MAVTDKQVEAARDRVDGLREQIAAEKAKLAATVQDTTNDATKAALDREADSLRAELAAVQQSVKDSGQVPDSLLNGTVVESPATVQAREDAENAKSKGSSSTTTGTEG